MILVCTPQQTPHAHADGNGPPYKPVYDDAAFADAGRAISAILLQSNSSPLYTHPTFRRKTPDSAPSPSPTPAAVASASHAPSPPSSPTAAAPVPAAPPLPRPLQRRQSPTAQEGGRRKEEGGRRRGGSRGGEEEVRRPSSCSVPGCRLLHVPIPRPPPAPPRRPAPASGRARPPAGGGGAPSYPGDPCRPLPRRVPAVGPARVFVAVKLCCQIRSTTRCANPFPYCCAKLKPYLKPICYLYLLSLLCVHVLCLLTLIPLNGYHTYMCTANS